ncbi:M48 family metallopeptidase [Solilutibacter tolerans]|uniref:Peptidase family M48 n=1 Tax=Solilutibacter tolerans TaxID=1604334 RepID=A0A1N6PLZ3_9GAMM|nr:M48 family metallopeptidase [Lysobacter tolerans]SIQ05404.1 Peptidase family M48 [Lysobacter tolerans]
MRQDPSQSPYGQPRRRGFGFNPRLLIIVAFAAYGLYYYFSNRTVDPYTGEKVLIDKSIDAQQEEALGLQAYQEILQQEQPVDPNSQIAQQIRGIAGRLVDKIDEVEGALAQEHGMQANNFAKDFNWQVTVLNSQQANAFALPGGKMAVYTGLVPVAQNADGMAVVMGHEIAHALMRHGAQRMSRGKLEQMAQMGAAAGGVDVGVQQAIFSAYGVTSQLPYARGHESSADEVGLMLMAAACFNPDEAVPLWERMAAQAGGNSGPEFASTHPSPQSRIEHLRSLLPKAHEYRQRFCTDGSAKQAGGATF